MRKLIGNRIIRLLRDQDLGELLREGGVTLFMKFGGMIFSYSFALLVTRILGTNAWGSYSLCLSLVLFGSILVTCGLDTALVRFVSEAVINDECDRIGPLYLKATTVLMATSVVVSVASFKFVPVVVGSLFNKPHLAPLFKIAILAIAPLSFVKITAATLRGLKRISEFSFLSTTARHLFPMIVFLVLLAVVDKDEKVLLYSFVIGTYIAAILSVILLLRRVRFSDASRRDISYKRLLRVAFPLMTGEQVYFLKEWMDTIMLGIFVSEHWVGVYNVALRAASLAKIALMSVNSIAAPKFAEYFGKKDFAGLQRTVNHTTNIVFCASFPVLLLSFIFAQEILGMFGSGVTEGALAFRILLCGQLMVAMSGSVAYVLQMTGKEIVFQNLSVFVVLVNLVLNYLLIPFLGIVGAAISTVLGVVLFNSIGILCIKRILDIVTFLSPGSFFGNRSYREDFAR